MFDRDWDEVDLDESLDLDDAGVEDMIQDGDIYRLVASRGVDEGFVEDLERCIDNAIAQLDEDEAVENILEEYDPDREYENYAPPYKDDEDEYSDGEQEDDEPRSTGAPDKGYEDYSR